MATKPDRVDNRWVRKFFDCSTKHVTSVDCKLLEDLAAGRDQSNLGLYVTDKDPGLIVSYDLDMFKTNSDGYEDIVALLNHGFSLAFIDIWREVVAKQLTGLWLDPDAPDYDDLPTFSWEAANKVLP